MQVLFVVGITVFIVQALVKTVYSLAILRNQKRPHAELSNAMLLFYVRFVIVQVIVAFISACIMLIPLVSEPDKSFFGLLFVWFTIEAIESSIALKIYRQERQLRRKQV